MYALDAVKEICKIQGISARKIGRDMGMGDNYVSRIANRGSVPRCDTMARMLDVCGYALCAVPYEQVTDNMVVITSNNTAEKREK